MLNLDVDKILNQEYKPNRLPDYKHENYQMTDDDKAAKRAELTEKAEGGDVRAMTELGHAYQTGELGVTDYDLAFRFLKMAVDTGDAGATIQLAPLYILGQGTEKSFTKGFETFLKGNELGHPKAGRYLATHYELGIGTPVNYAKAAELYYNSAVRGDMTAKCQLGSLYERGLAVPQDYDIAEKLYLASAQRADIIASPGWACAGNLWESRTDGKQDLAKAKEYYRLAADVGNPDGAAGLLRLGHHNPHPQAPGHNYSLTVLCIVSDLHGDPVYERAIHYALEEEQTLQDAFRARKAGKTAEELAALNRASDMGYGPAKLELAKLLREGVKLPKDEVLAAALEEQAAEQGL